MANVSILWRLVDGPDATGHGAYRIGDIVTISTADHEWNSTERTQYGIAIVTDIPIAKLNAILEKLQKGIRRLDLVKDNGDGTVLVWSTPGTLHFPARFRITLEKCIQEWPALEDDLTNKLFNPEFTVPQAAIPSLTWAKFKAVFFDRVENDYVSDVEPNGS